MSRSILDDNHDHAKALVAWLVSAVQGVGGANHSYRLKSWERIEQIAAQLSEHAKHAAEAEEQDDDDRRHPEHEFLNGVCQRCGVSDRTEFGCNP